MSQTEIDGPTNTSAARQLAELEAAFAEALSGYDEWQLARAWVPLVRLCATLPEGFVPDSDMSLSLSQRKSLRI
jgi:hypothetical protein